jgi:hypothetical protein
MRLKTSYRVTLGALMLALLLVAGGTAATQRTAAAPTISDFTPKNGTVGTKVIITGTGLTGAQVQFFNQVATAAVVNPAGTSITATVPAMTADIVPTPAPITIATPGGTVTSSANFAYGSNPSVAAPSNPQQAAIRYYTRKTQVKLRAGQTLHFKSGKGYYAA